MEAPLHSFDPSLYGINNMSIVFITLTVITGVILYFQNKKKVPYYEKKRKRVFSMLLFFCLIVFGATGILNLVNTWNLKTVKFYESSIETPQGRINYDDIQAAYIYVDKPPLMGPNNNDQQPTPQNNKMLIIEEYSRKTHVLSEENYQINDILDVLNQFRKKK